MVYKVFIDGQWGTTGLEIQKRLENRKNIKLLQINPSLRKNMDERLKIYDDSDIVFLCLPDLESKLIVSKADPTTRIIDASTAHRTSSGWTYGLPELIPENMNLIAKSKRVANPGCHATGFILLIRPLIDEGILKEDVFLSFNSLTGYSGGGKSMIEKYDQNHSRNKTGQYALDQDHKHLPEIMKQSHLVNKPVFSPIICDFYRGMLISIPLHAEILSERIGESHLGKLTELYKERYESERLIRVVTQKNMADNGFIYADRLAGKDCLEISICGNEERIILTAVYDNLGKGASGAAIQNMNLMLGIPEYDGLVF